MQSLTLLAFLTLGTARAERCTKPAVARGDRKEKEVENPCKTEVLFNTAQMCRHWSNVPLSNVTLFWTPGDNSPSRLGRAELRMAVMNKESAVDPTARRVVLVDERSGRILPDTVATELSLLAKNDSEYFPSIHEFSGRNSGEYRCFAALPCGDEMRTANFTVRVNQATLTSRPKGHIECAGCVKREVCEKNFGAKKCNGANSDKKFFVAYASVNANFTCKVHYPKCAPFPDAKWEELRDSRDWVVLAQSNSTDRFSILPFPAIQTEQSGTYRCRLTNEMGEENIEFNVATLNRSFLELSSVQITIIICVCVLICCVAAFASCLRKRFLQGELKQTDAALVDALQFKQVSTVAEQEPLLSHQEPNFWDRIPPELKVEYSKLQGHKNWIGAGNFGEVYASIVDTHSFPLFQSQLNEKRRVAVKTLKGDQFLSDKSVINSLIEELIIMVKVENFRQKDAQEQQAEENLQLYSQYVIQLLGCGLTPSEHQWPFLVIEYADNGDLLKFLQQQMANIRARRRGDKESSQALRLTDADLTKFSYQIAAGMAFLSSHGVVHRDLAARNVLISSDFTMKISDFGLSKDSTYYVSSGGKLPWKWMALESIADHRFTTHSDVWSFGITMWEIFTLGTTPYPTKGPEEVRQFLEGERRLEQPTYSKRYLYQIMLDCWSKTPKERPSFANLARDLRKELETQRENENYLDVNIAKIDDGDSGIHDGQMTPTLPKVTSPPPISPRRDL